MLEPVANSLVLAGTMILIGSLFTARKITRQLPLGRSLTSWKAMAVLILLFIVAYLGYLLLYWNKHASLLDLLVPGVFFFGACFVWVSSVLALQTAMDVMRITALEHENTTDALTGVYNRRFLEKRLQEEISKARRYDYRLSILMFDLDHFKRVNDELGHQAGDRVLIEISTLVGDELRDSDILARYGGEEFLIIAPNTDGPSLVVLAERLRKRVESHPFLRDFDATRKLEVPLTISIGIANFDDASNDLESLIQLADQNLYRAKHGGRNRVFAGAPPD